MTTLADFHQRAAGERPRGFEVWTAQAVGEWVSLTLARLLEPEAIPPGPVLDAGCGEQPFRHIVEASGRRYVGMDAVQNTKGTVDLIARLDGSSVPGNQRFPLILCTEVLEHVANLEVAVNHLRDLVAKGGAIVITAPFVYPVHMEPFDFWRFTAFGLNHLARSHGLAVEECRQLGAGAGVIQTALAALSVLPASATLRSRAKARAVRLGMKALGAVVQSRWFNRDLVVNSAMHLSNGFVLRSAS